MTTQGHSNAIAKRYCQAIDRPAAFRQHVVSVAACSGRAREVVPNGRRYGQLLLAINRDFDPQVVRLQLLFRTVDLHPLYKPGTVGCSHLYTLARCHLLLLRRDPQIRIVLSHHAMAVLVKTIVEYRR